MKTATVSKDKLVAALPLLGRKSRAAYRTRYPTLNAASLTFFINSNDGIC